MLLMDRKIQSAERMQITVLGPNADGHYTAWDHENGEYLEDRDGQTHFLNAEDAIDLAHEYA